MITQRLSDKAYDLILEFEVGGGQKNYERKNHRTGLSLANPNWPGGSSGVTIGIGYDLGMNTDIKIREDWMPSGLNPDYIPMIAACAGITGAHAKDVARGLSKIEVPWIAAWWVFNERTLPRFIRETLKAFPGAELKLCADGFGALVSLVFNRGGSMYGERRRHMREIRYLIETMPKGRELNAAIAAQIRDMIPLWKDSDIEAGMERRRNWEASMVESGT